MKLFYNYHTHTVYCNHADSTIEEMIVEAISLDYKTIGFSEHVPLKAKGYFRLNQDNYLEYLNEGQRLKQKYKDKIEVLMGFESEYSGKEYEYFKKIRSTPGCDYMIFGNHNLGNPHERKDFNFESVDLNIYASQMIEAGCSNLFCAIAHPDYIYRYYLKWDEAAKNLAKIVIDVSIKHDLPLGFNMNGLRSKKTEYDYPCEYFWKEVSKSNAKVIIEADAHDKYALSDELVKKASKLIKILNLEKNLISKLTIK